MEISVYKKSPDLFDPAVVGLWEPVIVVAKQTSLAQI